MDGILVITAASLAIGLPYPPPRHGSKSEDEENVLKDEDVQQKFRTSSISSVWARVSKYSSARKLLLFVTKTRKSRLDRRFRLGTGIVLVRFSLFLSLVLFSLAILETIPSTWSLVLCHDESFSGCLITSEEAYRLTIWADCILIAVIVPSLACSNMIRQFLATRGRIRAHNHCSIEFANGDGGARSFDALPTCRSRNIISTVSSVFRIFLLTTLSTFTFLCHCVSSVWHNLSSLRPWRGHIRFNKRSFTESFPWILVSSSAAFLRFTTLRRCSEPITRGATLLFMSPIETLAMLLGVSFGPFLTYLAISTVQDVVEVDRTTTADGDGARSVVLPHIFDLDLGFIVAGLCSFGVVLSAILNGFGSVSFPHSCLAGLYLKQIPNERIISAEEELKYTRKVAMDKRETLADLRANAEPGDSGSGRCPRTTESTLLSEIQILDNLGDELHDDVEEMKSIQASAEAARTAVGRIRSYIGMVFSVVLLVRVSVAAFSAWRLAASGGGWTGLLRQRDSEFHADENFAAGKHQGHTDLITAALLWLIGHHLVDEREYGSLSQVTSLALAGFLSISQIHTFLKTASTVRRWAKWPSTNQSTSHCDDSAPESFIDEGNSKPDINAGGSLYDFAVASAMGCYFLSCVVLLKMNLPPDYRRSFTAAIGGVGFDFDMVFSNTIYVASATASVIVLSFLFGVRRRNSFVHASSRVGPGNMIDA